LGRQEMSGFVREFVVPGTVADLAQVNEFIENCCEEAGVDLAARFDLQLAVEEACCNVMEHAYDGNGGRFGLRFETRGRDVVIALHDWGQPFDPASIPSPDMNVPLEDRPIGGLGIHLMRQVMDDVRFTFSDDGNTLEMAKRGVLAESQPPAPEERRSLGSR